MRPHTDFIRIMSVRDEVKRRYVLTEWHKDKYVSCRKLVQPGKLEVCSHRTVRLGVPTQFSRCGLLALIHF